ncbi:1-(5-phosphoribosyl)-5-[(5-phosphoribosylamino)methylideneamino] imidazole-4-carboxamide isomerase [Clostridium homopropionicum DSM 5847]|uniref:1-(5-phosphoribosyl)-5-[(5-phosphoribosylamino)methylideneamino] imidazole-4-carboxamide isomerase n=1 Tax=Clostridium homopropionicum DSM 5847 TaxID=1121318 RepID=A0A0L6ZAF5_9CLOT|nr:1-(5-phosphoribosyl)-5-[(5-phosphoribosylamino)methylideneamino]imidazole-4-carboxamide isomerase [Clostridium homopropionicum]KOA19954.1 1-(5-phosphoribosyl)-5-[(5-phosphoribosylamino)methylideneamino] imidazole-4-carboxamide isomerase [Clostridium homopropionicum DSM 5847]SFG88451.1 1-(5-phosphoribosyl)-5-[(5-phosphoribosylamino)methylideneamino] imidazole-4-carboxamide isomerase [Clostridium homopropionicum]
MIILPAIDLKGGKCVRLYKGDFNKTEVVAESALDTALSFKAAGAEFIHMVDLDGALKGKGVNYEIVSEIVKKVNVPVELGGGIRDMETIDFLINIGLSRVILGTAALNNPELVKTAVKKYGDKIAVGIDAKDGFVAVDGWINVSKVNYIDFAKEMEKIGVKTIIFTDISKDGTLQGPNLEQLGEIQNSVSCNIVASGGIKNLDDLKNINNMGIYGAITGKAIYSGNINLKEAIDEFKR